MNHKAMTALFFGRRKLGWTVFVTVLIGFITIQCGYTSSVASYWPHYGSQSEASKEVYYQNLVEQDMIGIFNGQALYDLCASATWNGNLTVKCPPLEGGYGNTRQILLECIRLAIEVRGSFVVPQIALRADDLSDFRTENMAPLEYLFDTKHLMTTLTYFCPQLRIIDADSDQTHSTAKHRVIPLTPLYLEGVDTDVLVVSLKNPAQFLPAFSKWLEVKNATNESPVLVDMDRSIMRLWLTSYDPPALVRTFGGMVRPNAALRQLAAKALAKFHIRYGVSTSIGTTFPYVGVHLRAESDATWVGYGLQAQAQYYTARLKSLGSTRGSTVYVACGDTNATSEFRKLVHSHHVVTKDDLLAPEVLSSFTWDQRALIDFEVLQRSSYFMGIRPSSFATVLMLRRAAKFHWVIGGFPKAPCMMPDHKGNIVRRGCMAGLKPGAYWQDNLSELMGDHKGHDAYIEVNTAFP